MRPLCSIINAVAGKAELSVWLMLSSGLILSFFQAFQLGIEGADNEHVQCEFHDALLDNIFSTQLCSLAKSPHIVDTIAGHHRVLRDIHRNREAHPWFNPRPESEEEEEVGIGGRLWTRRSTLVRCRILLKISVINKPRHCASA